MAAAQFDLEYFLADPSIEQLKGANIKKDQWKAIAEHFDVPITTQMTKEVLKNVVIEHLVEQGQLLGHAIEELTPMSTSVRTILHSPKDESNASQWEIEKLKLEYQLKMKEMEIQAEKEERQLRAQKDEREFQLQLKRQEKELEMQELTLKNDAKFRGEEIDLKKKLASFNPATAAPLVPSFDESDVDGSFRAFESVAHRNEWPQEQWVSLLVPKLVGIAYRVYNNLGDKVDYEEIKSNILDAYSITPDGYRQQFRDFTKPNSHTFVEFAREKLRQCKKWLTSLNITTFSELLNLIVLEEWKNKLPFDILRHVEERGESELMSAAKVADAYALLMKSLGSRGRSSLSNVKSSFGVGQGSAGGKPTGFSPNVYPHANWCSYCKKPGHTIHQCRHPHCKVAKSQHSFVAPKPKTMENRKPVALVHSNNAPPEIYESYLYKGKVSLPGSKNGETTTIRVLRDTGAVQSIIKEGVIPNIEQAYTGERVILEDLTSHPSYPLANINLQCPFFSGEVAVAVKPIKLPVPGVDLLLGNDIAMEAIPNLIVLQSPSKESPTETLDETSPHFFPVCVVTRSQSKSPAHSTLPSPVHASPDHLYTNIISKENLIKAHEQDLSLAKIKHVANDVKDMSKLPVFYYQEGVLMRAYRPPELQQLDTWSETHQVVIPLSVRPAIMELAHDGLSGHLGIQKTYKKILQHFFWPGMKKEVSQYVKTCHVCQVIGKPNKPLVPAPLKPIPVQTEPFEKIVLDCVGPLPKSKRGNQYLLTIMDPTTRYPEAIPLKNITSKTIVKHLIHFFTSVGIPKQIQSDRGSNFTSNFFQQIVDELNIEHVTSTAYHPQSQGCLERFHQTLKSMLKKYCLENQGDWDESIDFLLFALRESPQESLGYSPFELLYGRQIRGPLKLLKDQWFTQGSPSSPSVSDYISNLKNKISEVRSFAKSNLAKSQTKMQQNSLPNSIMRSFKPGDKVLLFLPTPGNALQSNFMGPYVVAKKLTSLNYVVHTPDRRKDSQLVHINIMKPYHSREPEEDSPTTVPVCVIGMESGPITPEEESDIDFLFPSPKGRPSNSQVMSNLDEYFSSLPPSQQSDLKQLLLDFSDITGDLPGRCNTIQHDITLISKDIQPIRQPYHRLSPIKKELMNKEVDYLLEHHLAEPSISPWASPCLLTSKPDGSSRFCTDYRQVNKVTVPDSYPLPLIEDLIDSVGVAKWVTTIDLLKGYYQIPLSDEARVISAFITPFGLYQYTVMPFGLSNAPATFQRAINYVIQDLEGTAAYLDDLVVTSDDWAQHLTRLRRLMGRLQEAGFTINLAKSTFGRSTVVYLGHEVGNGKVRPKRANVEAILGFPVPTTRKSLMRFLGMAGFYRRFCRNFSTLAAPLTDLTSSSVPFRWTPACDQAFRILKVFLSSEPVVWTPDHSRPFHLQVDASGVGVGAVLLQSDPERDILHPVAYYSAKLKKHQLSYSTIEKEALALVKALQRFECYLHHGPPPTKIFTDHNPLAFLTTMKNKNQRILRWALLTQPFDLEVHHIKGVDNLIADTLSRSPVSPPT